MLGSSSKEAVQSFITEQIALVRKVLFSRSLRLLPLSHQVGVIEGLAALVKHFPEVLSMSDQHLLAFLSELLKMSSVADQEMSDASLRDMVVDRNGYTSSPGMSSDSPPTHSSSLFYRRSCALEMNGATLVVPEELPAGVQFRVSAIVLLHAVIRAHTDAFFDAEVSTPVGKCVVLPFPSQTRLTCMLSFPR
jgi:hypothetical protein